MHTIESIKEDWTTLATKLNGILYFNEFQKASFGAGIVTAKITYKNSETQIEIHQGIFDGGKNNINYNPLEINAILHDTNFKLNVWRLGFIGRFINRNRLKIGSSDFDNKIGLECSNENIVLDLFSISEIKNEFTLNKNLILNTFKNNNNNVLRLKCIVAPYDTTKIERLTQVFNKIIEYLQKRKN